MDAGPKRTLHTVTSVEVSAHMRSLAERRWKRYAERIARGEITAENYVYTPRGPMPPHSKAKQDFSRWERQIVNARFARLALEERPTRIWLNWRTPHGRE
jgi:hypothetical protein